jgi:hypothetical protein
MLPADLLNKNISPPFVILPGDNGVLPAEMAHGALTPQKRATTEQHSNMPVAKRLQLIHEAYNDLSSGTPFSLENNNIFNFNPEQIENSGDHNNIAGTPAFITNLMKFIKFSDEKRQNSSDMAQNQQSHNSTSTSVMMSSPKDASASAKKQAIWSADSYEGYVTPKSKLPSLSNACENSMITSHTSLPSMNQIIPNHNNIKQNLCTSSDTEDCVFDDDEGLLNNLPTSVDDLQDMEKQIKMERHFSSPLMSHRHTPSYYDAGRISAASGASFAFDGALSAASNHIEEELDADDLEVAMINESFEEQQRQYKLYCGDKLKSAFYSAPEESLYDLTVEHEPLNIYPLTVPENDEPLYTNDSLYNHWKEESPQLMSSTYDTIAKPIVSEIFNNIIPALDDDEEGISVVAKSSFASLNPSIPESMDSLKLYNSSLQSGISPPGSSFNSMEDQLGDSEEEDAMATVLSSANFVLEEMDSPNECDSRNASPLLMKSPSAFITPPPAVADEIQTDSYDSEDEEELVSAWKEIKHSGTTGDNVRYYFPRNHATPQPPPLLDKIEEPPKNIKSLSHVTEIYDPNGELDSEPALKYFQSIGMKNFYQREIDIQRAFLVFPTVEDAKLAVENNKTGLQLRLLEESPQFVKLKAIKMYSELRPCCYDSPAEPHLTEKCLPWNSLSEPIAGV